MSHLNAIDAAAAKRTPLEVLRKRDPRERIPFCAKN
jgi:hypothetical protein